MLLDFHQHKQDKEEARCVLEPSRAQGMAL